VVILSCIPIGLEWWKARAARRRAALPSR
jgi:hypothetical protein